MSGPKDSSYILEQRRREEEARRLEAERRRREEERRREEARRREEERRRREEEERRRREAEKKRQESLKAIGSMQGTLKGIKGEMQQILRTAEYMADVQNVTGIMDEINSEIASIDKGIRPYTSQVLDDVLRKEKEIRNLKEREEKNIVRYREEDANWKEQTKAAISENMKNLFSNAPELMTKKQLEAQKQQKEKEEQEEKQQLRMLEIQEEFAKVLEEVQDEPATVQEVEKKQEAFLQQLECGNCSGAELYYGMQEKRLKKLVEICKQNRQAREQFELLYRDAQITYEAACELAGTEPQEFLFTEDSIREMREETVRLESELLERREAEIVRNEIREVMAELGYEIIGSRETVRKGKEIRHQVFSYGEGTAIDVTEANGHITMEIVGLDTEDRAPTEKESIELEGEMISFCDTFDEAEVLMQKRGIMVDKRYGKLPPRREYAKILNMNHFEMQKEVETFAAAQKRKEARTERRGTAAAAAESRTIN